MMQILIKCINQNAESRRALVGNYEGTASRYITISEGIQDYVGDSVRVLVSEGCDLYKENWKKNRIAEVREMAEMGDVSRFDDVKEIQKLSGMGLVSCSSGKHKGQTKISHRGRKRLRYWLF